MHNNKLDYTNNEAMLETSYFSDEFQMLLRLTLSYISLN